MITGCSGFLGPHKQPPEAQSIADRRQPDSGLQSSCGWAGFASAGSGEHALPSTACTRAGFSPGSWGLFPGHPHPALQLSLPGASLSPTPNSDRRATDQLEKTLRLFEGWWLSSGPPANPPLHVTTQPRGKIHLASGPGDPEREQSWVW